MKAIHQVFLITIIICIIGLTFLFHSTSKKVSSVSPHIVISEIQVRSVASANDEFVELYNATETSINITGWKLGRKTAGGTESTLVASLSGTIPPKKYFLITSPESTASSSADQLYNTGERIAANNTIILYGSDGTTIIDLVGLGTASVSETSPIGNPVNGGSVERKAQNSSTSQSMGIGGTDEFLGNGWDTDNNSADFVQRTTSQPQNSQSDREPPLQPTPTPTNTPTPVSSPTPTITITPTPTNTPTPTLTPTHTQTPSPSPTPTLTPTSTTTPFPTITPTSFISPIASPTMSTTPIPTPSPPSLPTFQITCVKIRKEIKTPVGVLHFVIPSCKIKKI
ncbi:MAG: lamin tail domain-containing protein [Patescibacteria group bacterium]|nr:lamin tail domain-containing protein [Patescibacteria group bacterium]